MIHTQAWNEVSNMLFIDQPVTTGNSYSVLGPAYVTDAGLQLSLPNETCPDYAKRYDSCGTWSTTRIESMPRMTVDAAQSFYLALQGFVGAFPEYASAGVNIATESYGGHYAPEFAQTAIEKAREKPSGHLPLEVRTVAIGNGWYAAEEGYKSYPEYMKKNPYGLAFQNESIINEMTNALVGRGNCLDQIQECYRTDDVLVCNQANTYCDSALQAPFTRYLDRSVSASLQAQRSVCTDLTSLHP